MLRLESQQNVISAQMAFWFTGICIYYTSMSVFSLSLRSYACIGYMSEYTRCVNVNPNPPRTPFTVPVKIIENNPFLRAVRFNVGNFSVVF